MTLSRPISFARFLGTAVACVAGACALGFYPTWSAAGGDGLVAMAAAAAIGLFGAAAGYVPQVKTAGSPIETRVNAALIGLGIRLLLTLAVVFTVVQVDILAARFAFLIWAGVHYMVLLAVETAAIVRQAQGLDGHGNPAKS